MLPDKSGIYRIRHIESGKGYIGSALILRVRWNGHISTLRKQTHRNSYLQNAFNKYGEKAFIFGHHTRMAQTKEKMRLSKLGKVDSEETKLKKSLAQIKRQDRIRDLLK
jgi:hypothetical protein